VSGPFRKEHDPKDAPPPEEFQTWLSDRLCPVCRIALYSGRRKDVGLEACGGCGGVWVDEKDARHLLASKDTAFAAIAAAAAKGSERREPAKGPRVCPDCGTRLKEGYLEMGAVNVDVCVQHGTWFDAHELVAVVNHLSRQPPPGDFERPLEMETPFVQFVRKIFQHLERSIPGAR
jgi:Zn-finger nucleic acid-binding protein